MQFAIFFAVLAFAHGAQVPEAAPESRIIGGNITSINNYPYIVQVLYNFNFLCGGIILTPNAVLSAAQCFHDNNGTLQDTSHFSIRAGSSTLNTGSSAIPALHIIPHQSYSVTSRDNDIAIMVLTVPVTYSVSVQPAELVGSGVEIGNNVTAEVLGWGWTQPSVASLSTNLRVLEVRTLERTECARRYTQLMNILGGDYRVTDNMICAGTETVGESECTGDTGGPLVVDGAVAGVVAWRFSCTDATYPGVYISVASYRDWINATVAQYVSEVPTTTTTTTTTTPVSITTQPSQSNAHSHTSSVLLAATTVTVITSLINKY